MSKYLWTPDGVHVYGTARRSTDYSAWSDNVPGWQTALKWVVAISFIGLFGDWKSVIDYSNRRSAEIAEQCVSINSIEGRKLLHEIKSAIDETVAKSEDGTITPAFAAKQQLRAIDSAGKLEIDHTSYAAKIYQTAQRSFVANWQVPKEVSAENLWWLKDPETRQQTLETKFRDEFLYARDSKGLIDDAQVGPALKIFFFWSLKWYSWLMIPSFLIVLLNLWFAKRNLKEELILNWQGVVWRVALWPIGLAIGLDGPILAERYYRLKSCYLVKHDKYERDLNAEEKAALWEQAKKPVLRFDQALAQVRQAGYVARRPITVCIMVWIISVLNYPRQTMSAIDKVCVTMTQTLDNDHWENGGGGTKKGEKQNPLLPLLLLALLPSGIEAGRKELSEVLELLGVTWIKERFLKSCRSRGPPTTGHSNTLKCFAPGCWQQQRSGNMNKVLVTMVLSLVSANIAFAEGEAKPNLIPDLQFGDNAKLKIYGWAQGTYVEGRSPKELDPLSMLVVRQTLTVGRWEGFLDTNLDQIDGGNWLREAKLSYNLDPNEGEGDDQAWRLTLGRIFIAAGNTTPAIFQLETVNYPRSAYFSVYAYGLQLSGKWGDGWNVLADISTTSGLKFDDPRCFDFNRLEVSARLERDFGTWSTAGTIQAARDFSRFGLEASFHQDKGFDIRGALFYEDNRNFKMSNHFGGYVLASYRANKLVELHAMLDHSQDLAKNWIETNYGFDKSGQFFYKKTPMQSSSNWYTAVTVGSQIFIGNNTSFTVDCVVPVEGKASHASPHVEARWQVRF